jgi:hypothetical protein
VDEVSAGKTATEKPDSKQPAKPAQQKADVQTLAFLLRNIEIKIEMHQRNQRIAGGILFIGGVIGFLLTILNPDHSLAAACGVILAYGFSLLWQG